jgi:hypothetical protein
LDILVKEVASEDLLSVLEVDGVRRDEEETEQTLGHELHVLVVEKHIVVVEEQELKKKGGVKGGGGYRGDGEEDHVLLVVGVVNIQVSHVIIPFGYMAKWIKEGWSTVMGVEEHGVEREFRTYSFDDIQQI